jgi:hypothetical protein
MCRKMFSTCGAVDRSFRELLTLQSKFDTVIRLALLAEALLGFGVILKVACKFCDLLTSCR